MSKFESTDLFLLQRPSDPSDPYKAVTRDSMKYIGILTSFTEPSDPGEGALWWQPSIGELFVYHNGRWIDSDGGILSGKVSKAGDTMIGDLVMLNNTSLNFPLEGGLTIGAGASKGYEFSKINEAEAAKHQLLKLMSSTWRSNKRFLTNVQMNDQCF